MRRGGSIHGDGVKGGGIMGWGEEDFSKQFLPRRIKLAFECVDRRGGNSRSGEPVPKFYTSY